jgi:hypothetical protein
MRSGLNRFLLRYWILVIIVPAVALPTYSFFYNFTDIADFTFSQIWYEISKYLVPAILIFMVAGALIGALCMITQLLTLPLLIRRLPFAAFKSVFIIMSIFLMATPWLIWYSLGNPINAQFTDLVIPSYFASVIFWGTIFLNKTRFGKLTDLHSHK